MSVSAHHPSAATVSTRVAVPGDVGALVGLEIDAFATDRVSRRSFRNFLRSPKATVIVAESGGGLVGYALILFRSGSPRARLYSIAVAPRGAGRGIGKTLLLATEAVATARGCSSVRLEVHERNPTALALYRKAGYHEFGRHCAYYEDRGDALRLEKKLNPAGEDRRPPQ